MECSSRESWNARREKGTCPTSAPHCPAKPNTSPNSPQLFTHLLNSHPLILDTHPLILTPPSPTHLNTHHITSTSNHVNRYPEKPGTRKDQFEIKHSIDGEQGGHQGILPSYIAKRTHFKYLFPECVLVIIEIPYYTLRKVILHMTSQGYRMITHKTHYRPL